ncbi:glycoside hydrolase family 16 protein [Neolentinus lepideus HHB14362 ss-1]|uniref:Glycoside hydrolase family 16 protein n=1 Tax=Neolentinus lepideus HHB14362 ss-1 TaxID=1314782 RepID=A0A165VDZ6_9AGAM|nr:glycoside hydrolase family 16 protein [Neolentinus lepideus HHB14362 ss-1]
MLPCLILLSVLGSAVAGPVYPRANASSCACGYRDSAGHVWRESILSDFSGSDALSVVNENWAVETWGQQRQYHYMQYSSANVYNYNNALAIRTQGWSGNGSVYTGEIQTNRDDILYGTFRMYASIPTTPGVCFGFFSYYSDSQESDIEFLTNVTDYSHIVHYTNQPGNTSSNRKNVTVSNTLTSFNEHRFDWLAKETIFYVNGKETTSMTADVPNEASHILANVWSDGNPTWSYGPPAKDAVATVQYINLYFNSTSYNETAFNSNCTEAGKPAVCQV